MLCVFQPRCIIILFFISFSNVMGNVVTLKKRWCLRKIFVVSLNFVAWNNNIGLKCPNLYWFD